MASEKAKGRRLALRRSAESRSRKPPTNSGSFDGVASVNASASSEDKVFTPAAISPNSTLHNLTVAYHYDQSESPLTASTRSLSELSSALPCDGAPLRSQQHPLNTSPQPTPSSRPPHKQTPTSSTLCYGRVRKRLKIDPDAQNSAEIQSLLKIASQVCSTHDSSSPEEVTHSPSCNTPSPTHNSTQNNHETESPYYDDDDEAFWSQAAEVLEGQDWEADEEKAADGDSAFIDELLLSGLIRTPQMCIQAHQSPPDTRHGASPPPHSTPQQVVVQSLSSSSSLTTPLSHRSHFSAHKLNLPSLF